MNLTTPQSRAVVSLPPGQATTFTDGMDRPILLRIPHGEPREHRALHPPTVATASRRTAACGTSCSQTPCTVRDIATAARILRENPTVTVWIELLTVAHLANLARPAPPELAGAWSDRELQCALAEAITTAVAGRAAAITADVDPEALSKHLSDTAAALLTHREPPCQRRETEWQAGFYRYADIADDLRDYDGRQDAPHPATDLWRRRGLNLTGTSINDQIDSILEASAGRPSESLLFGDGRLTSAASKLSSASDRAFQIIEAAKSLKVPDDWHHHIFRSVDPMDRRP